MIEKENKHFDSYSSKLCHSIFVDKFYYLHWSWQNWTLSDSRCSVKILIMPEMFTCNEKVSRHKITIIAAAFFELLDSKHLSHPFHLLTVEMNRSCFCCQFIYQIQNDGIVFAYNNWWTRHWSEIFLKRFIGFRGYNDICCTLQILRILFIVPIHRDNSTFNAISLYTMWQITIGYILWAIPACLFSFKL